MDASVGGRDGPDKVWLSSEAGDFDDFVASLASAMPATECERAASVAQGIPIYVGEDMRRVAGDTAECRALMAEWVSVLSDGPGIVVITDAMPDLDVVDRATEVFADIIERERAVGAGSGDHFAKPGANDRVWNALEKHCIADPANFARYYASDAIAMASEAWLGRGYQITAQVNRVNPGGAAQKAHRDYHLGFMTPAQMAEFPAQVHRVSPLLTLQGAVAHCDMPVESGPTMFLPGSQRFFEGYLAFGRDSFQAFFAEHHVQLPLNKGDAVFFNPAVMHGAGANRTADIFRLANLLQVSSPFGRAMESVDRTRMVEALYPDLLAAAKAGDLDAREIRNVIAASAEGYAFPTNLDSDPPIGGLAPPTQAEHLWSALEERVDAEAFTRELRERAARRRP